MAARKKWKPVQIDQVDELVAEDWWEFSRNGKRFNAHISVGRPAPDPSGRNWYCPLRVEGVPGWPQEWRAIYGVFALDAATNAFGIVSRLFHDYGPKPLGQPPRRPQRTKR